MSYVLQIEQEPAGTYKWGVYDGADSGNLVCDSWCGGYRGANAAFNVGWERLRELKQAASPRKPVRRINLVRLEAESDWRFEVWVQDGPCWNCVYRSDIYPCPKTAAIIGKNWLDENP